MTPGLSPLCRFGSNPVAEQYLTVEDGCLSPPGFRQQSSVAEHFLAVEDGFTSSSKLLKTVSGVSNIYGTTYGLKYINIYIYIENPRIEQTRKLASLAIMKTLEYGIPSILALFKLEEHFCNTHKIETLVDIYIAIIFL